MIVSELSVGGSVDANPSSSLAFNSLIAERAFQAIRDITPQVCLHIDLEEDIRQDVRAQYEENLLRQKAALEEKVRIQCTEEIEERLSVVQKDTIEQYKHRKKIIEEKERALSNERKRLSVEIECAGREQQEILFGAERDRLIAEVTNKLDRTRLISEVEVELKKEINRDLLMQKEKEVKRKETILKLNFKKKFEAERAQLEEQIKLEFDELVDSQLQEIAAQRSIIATETAEKQQRITQLQADKKTHANLLVKSREKHAAIIEDLQTQIASLTAIRDQLGLTDLVQYRQQQLNTNRTLSSVSPNSRRFRSSSPPVPTGSLSNTSRDNASIQQQRSNRSIGSGVGNVQVQMQQQQQQQQQVPQNVRNTTTRDRSGSSGRLNNNNNNSSSNNNNVALNGSNSSNSIRANATVPLRQPRKTSEANSQHDRSGSSLREDSRSQPASSYLSDKVNTVVEDNGQSRNTGGAIAAERARTFTGGSSSAASVKSAQQAYHKMRDSSDEDDYASEVQGSNEIMIQSTYKNEEMSSGVKGDQNNSVVAQNAKAIAHQKDLKDRVSGLLSEINSKYTPDLRDDIEDFILSATVGAAAPPSLSDPSLRARGNNKRGSERTDGSSSRVNLTEEERRGDINRRLNARDNYASNVGYRQGSQESLQDIHGDQAQQYGTNRGRFTTEPSARVADRQSSRFEDWTSQSGRRGNYHTFKEDENEYEEDEDRFDEQESVDSSSSSVELERELRANNKERVRPKEIMTEDSLWNYLIQQKAFPSRKQYALLWKPRACDNEEDKKVKAIKITIDYILEEEKEYAGVFEQKVNTFERDLPAMVRRFAEETWSESEIEARAKTIKDQLVKLKLYWHVCDTSFKERIQTLSILAAQSCMIAKLERSLRDAVDVMEIVRNNLIVVRIGQQLQERYRQMELMKSEFCLNNYRKYKEDLKTIQQQINVLNNEYQISDQKGKKSAGSRLTRSKHNEKSLFWRNIKLSDIIRIDKWEEQKLQQCLIRLKLQGFK